MFCGAGYEGFEVGLGEAVEEEVGDDEIVRFGCRRGEGEGAGLVGLEAGGRVGGFAALAEELEHGGAGVYGVHFDDGVRGEELGGEAAVSVTQDEGFFLLEQTWEEVEAAMFEGAAEGEVFKPAIGAGDEVEVWFSGFDRGHRYLRNGGL